MNMRVIDEEDTAAELMEYIRQQCKGDNDKLFCAFVTFLAVIKVFMDDAMDPVKVKRDILVAVEAATTVVED